MTQSNGHVNHITGRTWTTRRITVIISIAIIYGIWFNFIDTIIYCYNNNSICKSLGEIFGGNFYYQPWNVLGHMIPGLFLLLYFRSKKEELAIIELFLAGILISTVSWILHCGGLFDYTAMGCHYGISLQPTTAQCTHDRYMDLDLLLL